MPLNLVLTMVCHDPEAFNGFDIVLCKNPNPVELRIIGCLRGIICADIITACGYQACISQFHPKGIVKEPFTDYPFIMTGIGY